MTNDVFESILLADRNSPANVWLRENPAVLGSGALVLGFVILYFGVIGLKAGTAKDKWGNEMTGGMAKFVSLVRVVLGLGSIGVGLYVFIFGAW